MKFCELYCYFMYLYCLMHEILKSLVKLYQICNKLKVSPQFIVLWSNISSILNALEFCNLFVSWHLLKGIKNFQIA